MRRSTSFSWVIAVMVCALVAVSPRTARAEERTWWGSFALDATFRGTGESGRGDLSHHVLMSGRAHFALGPEASISVGVGLPYFQTVLAGLASGSGSSSKKLEDHAVANIFSLGAGVTLPVEVRLMPGGTSRSGVLLMGGATPLLETATVCALGGECAGRKRGAVLMGYALTAGVGWQWSSGAFLSLAYSAGHMWPVGHSGGVPALEGLYHGGALSFGFAFGR